MRPAGLRSARAVLIAGCLLLIALPLLFLGLAHAYEAVLVRALQRDLRRLATQPVALEPRALQALGQRAQVLVAVIGRDGAVRLEAGSADAAMDASLLGGAAERLLERVWTPAEVVGLGEIERRLGPLGARAEVQRARAGEVAAAVHSAPDGQAVVVHVAAPLPAGEVLYLSRGSRRGLRQLLLLRHQLLKLILYQCVFALLLGGFLSRYLVTPLERLARAAQRYPQEPLGDPRLLARRDELGALARSIRALAEDLEARRRATADLGADVAHEFKNPLATIAASVDLLSVRSSPERLHLAAAHIEEAVARLRRSLDALLSLLRLEATLKDEEREALPYGELLEEIVADYRRDPRWADVTLRVECDAAVGEVRLVSQRWEELLRNLLDNALVQPAARREVLVRATREGAVVTTAVRDHGPGVSPGNRDKIFRRFFTQRPAGAPAGTGLGLSIVQAVAEAHGGRVEVQDPAEGPGAVFVVTMRS